MILPHNIIAKIQDMLEKGFTVELRVEEGDPLPLENGQTKPRPLQVTVFKRPDTDADIKINPTLINQERTTQLNIDGINIGEDPIRIATVTVPAGFVLAGLKGYKYISQEIVEGD